MKPHRHFSLWRALMLLAAVSLLFTACIPEATGTPIASSSGIAVWLDQPPDGVTLPLAPYTLKAHARHSSGGGIVNIAFLVSGGGAPAVTIGSVPTDSTAPLAYGELAWNPSAPGDYLIQAQAFSNDGYEFSTAARVCVAAADGSGCDAQPAASAPPEQGITATPQQPIGAIDIKAGAAPNPVYYGKCVNNEPGKLVFEAYLFPPETAVLEVDLFYNWLDSGGGAVGSPAAAQMPQIETGHYGYSIDPASEAAGILGSGDGSIEYRIIVLDAGKNTITEYGPDRVSVLFCASDQQKPTDTPAPQKPSTTPTTQQKPPTATFTPTPTFTSVPGAEISFTADSTNLNAGQCTTLRWQVRNATTVFLNGGGVPGEATSDVCPATTTTYTLRVQTLTGGAEERSITINVTPPTPTFTPAPQDTQGPSIGNLNASPKAALYGSSCAPGATLVTFGATASDPSGISQVQVWYGYSAGGAPGGWWPASVSDLGGGNYGATINTNDQAYGTLGGLDGTLYWYVLATDGASNTSNSGNQTMAIQYCIG